MAKTFAHAPEELATGGVAQRLCYWDEDLPGWLINWDSHDNPEQVRHGEPCTLAHPEDKVEDGLVQTEPSRGAFGMPGLGAAGMGMAGIPVGGIQLGDEIRRAIEPRPAHRLTVADSTPQLKWEIKFTEDGMKVEFADGKGYVVPAVTEEAREACSIIHDVMNNFLTKNAQYARAQTGHDLGLKGIIPDINRKSSALISRIWDHDNVWDEQVQDETEELAGDLIGHCLLLLAKIKVGM